MKTVMPSFSQKSSQLAQVTRLPHHWWASSWAAAQSASGPSSTGAIVSAPSTENAAASCASPPATRSCAYVRWGARRPRAPRRSGDAPGVGEDARELVRRRHGTRVEEARPPAARLGRPEPAGREPEEVARIGPVLAPDVPFLRSLRRARGGGRCRWTACRGERQLQAERRLVAGTVLCAEHPVAGRVRRVDGARVERQAAAGRAVVYDPQRGLRPRRSARGRGKTRRRREAPA